MFADMKSENGRPAGYGTVRYKNPDDAMRAIGILCCVSHNLFVNIMSLAGCSALFNRPAWRHGLEATVWS